MGEGVAQALRRTWRGALLALLLLAPTGCSSPAYVAQAIHGHLQILSRSRPIEQVLADPATPAPLAQRLHLVLRLRAFAAQELRLPVDGHYHRYADIGRPYVVWNVSATPEFSLTSKTWWYPVVGSLEYRGYFSESAARQHAARLTEAGYDVHVGGVQAYSTLGWFRDPVLNTFINEPEPELADTLFHELAHQRVFAAGDTDFDEAFATTVAREGVRRWLRVNQDSAALSAYETAVLRETRFMELVAETRDQLARLFPAPARAASPTAPRGATQLGSLPHFRSAARDEPDVAELRTRKAAVYEELRRRFLEVREREWGGDPSYDGWFRLGLNNAMLNDVDSYYRLVPAFESLLERCGGDLERFYARVERLARLDRETRLRELTAPRAR